MQLAPRTSQATLVAVVVSFILTALSSLRARGLRQTLLFIILGLLLPIAAEYHAINHARILRHHLQPQLKGVPLAIGLAWYITGYNTFAMIESLLAQFGIPSRWRALLLPVATAVTATSMDLVTDVALLDQGYWEWTIDGAYAADVSGPNGKRGVPLENYVGWLVLTSLVTGLFVLLRGKDAEPRGAHLARAGRQSALLLLPSYAGAAAWEAQRRRWRYILYSALFPAALARALLGNRGAGAERAPL
jgi:uncharacterized membrane protein